MPEDIIKGKIVFEGGGVGGGIGGSVGGGGGTATMSGSVMSKRGLMGAVTIPITDVLGQISKGISKLGQISPILGAEFLRLRKGLSLFLMPIGDTIANWVRPMAQSFLESAAVFYEEYKDGGLTTALANAIGSAFSFAFPLDAEGNISFQGLIENWDDISDVAGVMAFGILGMAGVVSAAAWFVGLASSAGVTGFAATAGGQVVIAAALFFAGKEALKWTGIDEWSAMLYSTIAAGLGIGAAFVYGTPAGIAVAIGFAFMAWAIDSTGIATWAVALIAAIAIGLGVSAAAVAGVPAGIIIAVGFSFIATGMAGIVTYWDKVKRHLHEMSGGVLFPVSGAPREFDHLTENPAVTGNWDDFYESMNENNQDVDDSTSIWSKFFTSMQSGWDWLTTAFETGHSLAVLDLFPMLGDSMMSTWTNKLEPSFLHMQDAINDAIYRVVRLHTEVLALPNINRTITYTIRYEVED